MTKLIVHISEVNIATDTGMGRVEWYWKKAFEETGYKFIHIGPAETGPCSHPGLFPYKARKFLESLKLKPSALIIHEPASGLFTKTGVPLFVESHGVEQRFWELWKAGRIDGMPVPNLKSRLLFPLWRLSNANKGLKKAHKLLLLNNEDKSFVMNRFKRSESDIFVFDNGVDGVRQTFGNEKQSKGKVPLILFNGSWIPRKGTGTLIKAVNKLAEGETRFRLMLIGTGTHVSEDDIRKNFSNKVEVSVVRKFKKEEEHSFLSQCDIFVLPSFYEGKPLSLLQAMATGLCCVTTAICGQKDLIKTDENGYLFDPGDAESLYQILQNLLQNPSLITKAGENAARSVTGMTWDKVSKDIVSYIAGNI